MDPTVNFYVPIILAIVLGLCGWILAKVNTIDRRTEDLHKWHAPDDAGQQTWKNADVAMLCSKVDDLTDEIKELVILFRTRA